MGLAKGLVAVGVIGMVLYMGKEVLPRGIRNKNPLNIEYNKANNWEGQVGVEPEGRFARFKSADYGIRAGAKLISTYMSKHKLLTVQDILGRFAPASENHTEAYADFVAKSMGVKTTDRLSQASIPSMVKAMIKFENGINPYTDSYINKGCQMAGVI
ncbi:structural protein P5 [Vibrio vulnificus]|uniref:structural protein P5 n=1 Tax=Vibrio vulnificus TaxID=672 RepID=UPI00102B11EF|nr:structural protein P5 [Vibrio vulnificus]EHY1015188.1 structural protein P5 [Vibrio vulnificus]RZR40886.1 structural protein P5 [Vibrio vulnificus]